MSLGMISHRIRQMTGIHWIVLFSAILVAWGALYLMSVPADVRVISQIYGADFWASLCVVTPDAAGYLRIFSMWALMSAAMMAPTALTAFATYEDLGHTTQTKFTPLVVGYAVVWLGYSAIAAAVQIGLYQFGLIDAFGTSLSKALSAFLLLIAGAYQFSPIKEACLSKCRMPLTFFMQHFEEGPFRNGVRLGLICLGCCWALMALAFVGGVMNLAFMGLATILMILEKMPDLGKYLTKPLGGILIALGLWFGFGLV
jgi:predicted metal-binding membrane protein